MKIIGKNSFLYWAKYPFLIYTIGFVVSSVWICSLIVFHLITGKFNSLITDKNSNGYNVIQFKYPFSQMVIATENSTEGILLTLLGIGSVCFVLIYAFRIIRHLSGEHIFSTNVVSDFKILSIGLIAFGLIMLLIDLTVERNQFDFTPPLFYVVIGFVLLFVREIFAEGKMLQDQTDLTI